MAENAIPTTELEQLQRYQRDVQELLRRRRLLTSLAEEAGDSASASDVPTALERIDVGLSDKLERMHPADVASILEALPLEERLALWNLVKPESEGDILLEVSDAVRESLIASMDSDELVAATENLEADEIADLAPDLPAGVVADVFRALPVEEREQLRAAMSYSEDMVGALMDFDVVAVREDVTLEVVMRYMRRLDELPDHTDQLFVVNREERFLGALPLKRLIVSDLDDTVARVMVREVVTLGPDDKAKEATKAFERYDLISAPVVDDSGRLIGRVTIDKVVDYIREKSENEALAQAGLHEEEDLFSSVWASVKNRWKWLAINLVTAFIASRVIGIFENSIERLVALATLMPIVAGIGGNSGNQTITMIVRSIALGQVQLDHAKKLFAKEIGVAMANGVMWGGILGIIAYLLYASVSLSIVMTVAMMLNLSLAAIMGVAIPLAMIRFGRDPAVGSSVLITAVTDSGGFFIFLGLATLFLL
ncbi:MAG: magnesium transporter [Betaproteobacteria bacterium]|nr:magnesium transporter [Betaproteobacteria bacterium]